MQMAIDGPAGAGKSTIAQILAQKLQLIYIDTGAMYRALTWKALNLKIALDDAEKLYNLARDTDVYFLQVSDEQKIYCDSVDVSGFIRTPDVNDKVSLLASHSQLRKIMVEKQQKMAQGRSVVMDGRDVGECILPSADYKFFVTASLEERALRRMADLQRQGHKGCYEKVKCLLKKRDESDSNRETGSLKILNDSIVIDTDNKDIEEVIAEILSIVKDN
ncbi:MAG: (d)CMP kinase [Syntrophomonadaceae bacterium]|jgi:cytidylate kinase|nr:(d)CMP kinase [Syntrophomonadaceae bacterium]